MPPVVELPVAPLAARPKASAASGAAPVASASPQPAPWVLRAIRTEVTKPVGRCQIGPFTFSSTIAVENRLLDGGRLAMRVVQDEEKAADPSMALPVLLGKGYVVDASSQGLRVVGAEGAAVPDEEARRARALAATLVGWPGAELVAHPPLAGAEVAALEGPVAVVADVPLHGAQVDAAATAVVRFVAARPADGGDELVFHVTLKASGGDAGMCHHWTSTAALEGELRLRASSGAMLGLTLEGTTDDTEGLCQDPSGKPGPPPPPHACNHGKVSVEVRQPRVP